ncbi:hypothetical protein [Streptococcus gwangjuensis]|uniref:Uncharacterized protein n=1 Tax=Streptococcus gwangjuensis TaxID=1433513 RepID=A0A387BCA3_9STRE|nr:hypothetical protein [Streptococcus gwangjuense]AYF96250.1 hypothetical protein D7D53_07125 [Streptococcus gwangjuense]
MKVIDLIDLLQDGTLKFEEKENGKYFSLYSPTIDTGRKFLEIYNKDDVTWVKFHGEATLHSGLLRKTKLSGDKGPINREIKFEDNRNDVIAVAVASYYEIQKVI